MAAGGEVGGAVDEAVGARLGVVVDVGEGAVGVERECAVRRACYEGSDERAGVVVFVIGQNAGGAAGESAGGATLQERKRVGIGDDGGDHGVNQNPVGVDRAAGGRAPGEGVETVVEGGGCVGGGVAGDGESAVGGLREYLEGGR